MKRLGRPITWLCLAASLGGAAVVAETTRTQRYVVHVPPRVTVQSPAATTVLRAAGFDEEAQTRQTWNVAATSPAGVTVSFDAHAENGAHPANSPAARLELSVSTVTGAARWTITDSRNANSAIREARDGGVQVSSSTSGSAELVLDVTVPPGEGPAASEQTRAVTVTATVTSHE